MHPPKFAKGIIEFFSRFDHSEAMIHSIEEEYYELADERGKFYADMWFWKQTIKSIPNSIKFSSYWGVSMLTNYFKTALRGIIKQKEYSLINIAGLAVGLAAAIIIMSWVQNELSYDNFHEEKENIYRVLVQQTVDGKTFAEADTPFLIADEVKVKIPGVEYSSIFLRLPRFVVKSGNKKFYEEGISSGGADFFSIFSFNFIDGNVKTALVNPGSIVISKSMAAKYFGGASAMGKLLQINGAPFTVTGIFENIPQTSHFQFDFMIDSRFIESNYKEMLSWHNFSSRNYIKLQKGTDKQFSENEINSVLAKNYNPEDIARIDAKFILQPVDEIHLTPGVKKYIYIFSLLVLLILFIASMNYVNLSTAISLKRLKEIGIRKVVGSNRSQLINQFLVETLSVTIIASSLAVLIDILMLPLFNQLVGKTIEIDFFSMQFLSIMAVVILVTTLLAGSYPAFFISSFKPVKILKGDVYSGGKSNRFRRLLVITQYTISIGMIICTIIVSKQVNFLKNKDLGFEKESIIYIPLAGNMKERYELVKEDLTANPNIAGAAASMYLPTSYGRNRSSVEWAGKDPSNILTAETPDIDYNFFDLLKLQIVRGRNFSREFSTDNEAVVINEEMAKQMNVDSPIGTEISYNGQTKRIIGTVKDANFLPLKYNIEPQVFSLLTDMTTTIRGVVLIKLNHTSGNEVSQTVSHIENIWNKYNPDEPFEFNFWSSSMEELYNSEQTISKLFGYFSTLAILISCLGLFGLASLIVEQKKKEIGIRKSIGASVASIILMLIKKFFTWILFANLIAWPVSYFVMTGWLNDFAYRIDITILTFILSGTIALLVALIAVSYQSIKASLVNPTESLRTE